MVNFESLNTLFPCIMDDLLFHFSYKQGEENPGAATVAGLLSGLMKKYSLKNLDHSYDIDIVSLCDSLCELGILNCLFRDNSIGLNNRYYWSGRVSPKSTYFSQMSVDERQPFVANIEDAVYGSVYIYKKYRPYIIPIIHKSDDGNEGIGTGFVVGNQYILTARHCIEHAKSIAFGNIAFENYSNAEVYYHKNPYIDIAIISIPPLKGVGLYLSDSYTIFDHVMTMGYPQIPGYTCFLTAEKAVISSIPEKRFVATEGQIVAEAQEIWSKENLFLITAKIRGGNSGGPVINRFGHCVGIVSGKPFSEGSAYDDLGYGTAIPAKFAIEMLENLSDHHCVTNINFVEYPQ